MSFLEPNQINVAKGDYVLVSIPHAENASMEEIANDFMVTGEVINVYHSERGALRVEVAGLEAKTGRNWTWQNRVTILDKAEAAIFETDEPVIEVSTFDLRQAQQRATVRAFRGSVTPIGTGEYEIHSFDSGNAYVVKVQDIALHAFRVNCTCPDFYNRKRVCKHISEVFSFDRKAAQKLAA